MLTQDDLLKLTQLIQGETRKTMRSEMRKLIQEELRTTVREEVEAEIQNAKNELETTIFDKWMRVQTSVDSISDRLKNLEVSHKRLMRKVDKIDSNTEVADKLLDKDIVKILKKGVNTLESHLNFPLTTLEPTLALK